MADRELSKAGRYLIHIANNHEDFRDANHAVSPFCLSRARASPSDASAPLAEMERRCEIVAAAMKCLCLLRDILDIFAQFLEYTSLLVLILYTLYFTHRISVEDHALRSFIPTALCGRGKGFLTAVQDIGSGSNDIQTYILDSNEITAQLQH